MAEWVYAVGDKTVGPQWKLEPQSAPTLNFYLTGQPHDFSCTIDARTEAGRNLRDLVNDVWIYRDGKLLFRGPMWTGGDTGDTDSHTVQVTANSYRFRLAHWFVPPATSSNGMVSLGTVATPPGLGWRAIQLVAPLSDLASVIVDKHVTAGTGVTTQAQGGSPIDATIDTFTQIQPFDWDMIPNDSTGLIEYTTWAPTRGASKPEVVLIYDEDGGASNATFARTFDMTTFGNWLFLTGQDANGNSVVAKAPTTPAFGPEGLYMVAGDSSNVDASQLPAQANTQLAAAETPRASYTFTPSHPEWWGGPDHVWLGDSIQAVIKSGRLDVDDMIRVQQIGLSPADGADNVTITVGAKPVGKAGQFAVVRTFRNIDKRIRALEWRQ